MQKGSLKVINKRSSSNVNSSFLIFNNVLKTLFINRSWIFYLFLFYFPETFYLDIFSNIF